MKYRAAIIGCGKIGSEFSDDPKIKGIFSHAGAYSACSNTDLVAVCDSNPEKAEKCKLRWGLERSYTDYHTMIEETKPDIVSVCTPDISHYQIIKEITEYNCVRAVFAEKPLALNISEAYELLQLSQIKKNILCVNYFRRYAPNHQELLKFLEDKSNIGDIQTVCGYYTKGIIHNGSHWLDLARFFIGEIEEVHGFQGPDINSVDPTLSAYILFKNGVRGFLFGCDEKKFDIFEFDIVGTKGRVRITDSGHTIELFQVQDDPNYSGYQALVKTTTKKGGLENSLLYAIEDIVKSLTNGSIPVCSGYDGFEAIKIGLSIRDSALSGKKVLI